MDSWHAIFLGLRHLPREVTAFEIEVFFQFSAEETRIIEERRRPELKLGLGQKINLRSLCDFRTPRMATFTTDKTIEPPVR
jgi:hypothetical protein